MRFTEVPPPLESRVTASVAARVREMIGITMAMHDHLNQSVHDREVAERAKTAAVDALKPGSLAFALLVVLALTLAMHSLLVRRHAAQILNAHDRGVENHAKAHAE